jgi:hypothetical protein
LAKKAAACTFFFFTSFDFFLKAPHSKRKAFSISLW